jgi:CTP:molybdopterin cytidylyltransferase MocA
VAILIAVLGAGRAARFGADKLTQPCAGKPLGQWALDAALATGLRVVLIGREDSPPPFTGAYTYAANPAADTGLASSVTCAARIAAREQAEALLLLLADMPLVTGEMLERLLATGAPAASLHAEGRLGVPALIPARDFAKLDALSGDSGAGTVLEGLAGITALTFPAEALLDVDTPAALARAGQILRQRHG